MLSVSEQKSSPICILTSEYIYQAYLSGVILFIYIYQAYLSGVIFIYFIQAYLSGVIFIYFIQAYLSGVIFIYFIQAYLSGVIFIYLKFMHNNNSTKQLFFYFIFSAYLPLFVFC